MARTCLLCGDLQQPSEYMYDGVSSVLDHDVELRTIEWNGDFNAEAFRDLTMDMESRGPNDYDPEGLIEAVEDVEILVVHKAPVGHALFEAGDDLEIVAAARGGTDNIDLEAAADHDVTVLHAPGRNSDAVSDYAVAFGLTVHRRIPYFTRTTDEGQWKLEFDPSGLPRDVGSLTVGIVGFGSIGRQVATRYAGFGPEIVAHDPYVDDDVIRSYGAEPISLESMLESADIVTLHVRLSEETKDLIGADAFDRLSEDALLVNTARGGLVDEDAMVAALRNDEIGGVALDVFKEEPLPMGHPLIELENAYLSPHTAGSTQDAVKSGSRIVARDIAAILDGDEPQHVIR